MQSVLYFSHWPCCQNTVGDTGRGLRSGRAEGRLFTHVVPVTHIHLQRYSVVMTLIDDNIFFWVLYVVLIWKIGWKVVTLELGRGPRDGLRTLKCAFDFEV